MIQRYTHPEMGRIWSDQRRYETWLLVESAAAEAMAAAGIVPAQAARDIRERGAFDISRIEEIEQVTQHDVIAFTTAVAEKVGESARWMHFGMTSSDVIDTAQALQMREACDVILKDLDGLSDAIRERAFEHRMTPMIGRTHGVHAEPMTLLSCQLPFVSFDDPGQYRLPAVRWTAREFRDDYEVRVACDPAWSVLAVGAR